MPTPPLETTALNRVHPGCGWFCYPAIFYAVWAKFDFARRGKHGRGHDSCPAESEECLEKSRLEAGCKCESDELACAGACSAGSGLGLLRCVAGKAGVRAVRPGPCEGEHGS